MLYFYFLASLALFACVAAQDCNTFNGTWTQPQVCRPSYLTPGVDAMDPTAGDHLSSLLDSLSPSFPSKHCAQVFSNYYCASSYPHCAADNITVKGVCRTACAEVLTACENDTALFGADFPTYQQCAALNDNDCITPGDFPAVLDAYYSTCAPVPLNLTNYDETQETRIMCRPDHTVPVQNISSGYPQAKQVFESIRIIAVNLSRSDSAIDDLWYPCIKAFSNFFCSEAFPSCNSNEALPLKGICASVCHKIITDCGNYTEYFSEPGVTPLPTADECELLPKEDCYVPANNSWVGFYFGNNDPPVPLEPVDSSSSDVPPRGNGNGVIYPPGGAAKGGGIGAGVLIGLLLVIGIVMLIMKKQDSR